MDEIDQDILEALVDGKQHTFQQILQRVSFTHNTQRLHPGQTPRSEAGDEGKD
jgi:hypothetical protein